MNAAGGSLLVVDDEPRVLDAVRRCVRPFRDEWEISFATSAADALAEFGSHRVDFLVTDMRMPKLGGAELLERVGAAHPGTARVVLSGQTEFEAAMRVTALAHQFIGKPCPPQALLQTVAAMRRALAWIDDRAVRDQIVSLTTLPSSPEACAALDVALARDPASADDAAEVVATDVAMSAKVLQVARSSFFGGRSRPNDVREAVKHVGLGVLRALRKHAFRSDAWPHVHNGLSLADSVGTIVHGLVPASRPLARIDVGETLLSLWGIAET